MSIRILVADDHRMLREGLRSMLSGVEGFRVVGDAHNGLETTRLVDELQPDVILVDVEMPGLNGIEATRKILAADPTARVIGVSMHCESHYVSEMLRAGAAGYVLKQGAFDELVQAVRIVANGNVYLSPGVASLVVDDHVRQLDNRPATDAFSRLTPREREVLQMLAEGKSSKQIGLALAVSSKTIDTYRQQLMRKLQLHSIAELTKFAIREGITALN